jgi:hypothetical protein
MSRGTLSMLLGGLAAFLLFSYGAFEARRLLQGPQVTILSPLNGSATSSSAVAVAGEAHNISFLTLNDKPIYAEESGHFSVLLSPPPGYTVFTVAATDRFGRTAEASVHLTLLNYCPYG